MNFHTATGLLLISVLGQVASLTNTFETVPGCVTTPVAIDPSPFCGDDAILNCNGINTTQFFYEGCPYTSGNSTVCQVFDSTFGNINCTTFRCDRNSSCGGLDRCLNSTIVVIGIGCLFDGDCIDENALYFQEYPVCKRFRCIKDTITGDGTPVPVQHKCPYQNDCENSGFEYTANCTTFRCISNGTFQPITTECALSNGTCIAVGQSFESTSPCGIYRCELGSSQIAELVFIPGCTVNAMCMQMNVTVDLTSNPCITYRCVDMQLYIIKTGCILQNGTCILDGQNFTSDNPCGITTCSVYNASDPAAVAGFLDFEPGPIREK